ncbi:nuclear transport factor 2 family protein [Segetibacter koreensis]|uniref:nuclear transport factor 2 family protein n=1 Tax=Segetibacter koreensis TaxID=398037 RepID=UPI00037BE94D|nr:nuclear transport factor 2 family protein [Segetibacter koreensis]
MEEQIIIKTITNIFNGSDKQDWELVRNSFYHEVFLDYFSLSKKPGEKVKSDEIVKGWSEFLPKFSFTHHVITNFEITVAGANAVAFCKGHALHHLPDAEGGDTWTVIGTYDFKLVKVSNEWKVNSMVFNLLYEDGNKSLPSIVAQ